MNITNSVADSSQTFNDLFQPIVNYTDFASNIFTILASSIAIYLFIFKRDKISSVFKILINYSTQISLNEIIAKLERINDNSVEDENQKKIILNLFGDIEGQIQGNKIFRVELSDIRTKLKSIITNSNELKDTQKRSIVSEIRERIRDIDLTNYKED